MIRHKITPYVDYNFWKKPVYTQLNESINQNSKKVPKVVNQQIRKH